MHRSSSPDLKTKHLISDRGFLIYITCSYDTMVPYLKGRHLEIDGWRENRDDDGWKLANLYSQKQVKSEDLILK